MGLSALAEAAVAAWLFVVGAAAIRLLRVAVGPRGHAILAYPTGVALYVTAAFLATVLDVTPPSVVAAALLTVGAAAALVAGRHAREAWLDTWALLVGSALVAALSVAFQWASMTRVTRDSLRYVEFGSLLQRGGLDSVPDFLVLQRPLFVPLLYGPAHWFGELFLASALPLLGLSGALGLVWFANRSLREMGAPTWARIALPAAVVGVLLTSSRFVYHMFYVNGHMAFAVAYLVLVVGIWRHASHPEERWVPLAAIAALAIPLMRLESPMMLLLAFVPAITLHRLTARDRWVLVAPAALVTVLYGLVVLADRVDGFDTSAHGSVVIGAAMLALLAIGHLPLPTRILELLPTILVALLTLPLLAWAVRDPSALWGAIGPTLRNIAGEGLWHATWIVIPLLVAFLALTTRVRHQRMLLTPIIGFLPLMILLGVVRGGGYRLGNGDSGNRMLMHVLLVALAYVVVAIGTSLTDRQPPGRPGRRGSDPEGSLGETDGCGSMPAVDREAAS